MERGRWKAGDLVRVESTQKTGWGDECHNHLVLVLRMYERKSQQQHYPLTAELEAGTKRRMWCTRCCETMESTLSSDSRTCLLYTSDAADDS